VAAEAGLDHAEEPRRVRLEEAARTAHIERAKLVKPRVVRRQLRLGRRERAQLDLCTRAAHF
jgi:hypothetical protein